MLFREVINKIGIVLDCEIAESRHGTYEIQFINSQTKEEDYATFDIIGAGTNDGNKKCEELFNDFCKVEGLLKNKVTGIHITKAV